MADNPLLKLRQAFSIPESVTIVTAATINNLRKSATQPKREDFVIESGPSPDEELYRSVLGTPVYADLQFLAGSYETGVEGVTRSFESVTCVAVLITVFQAKKIIRTEIQGRDGTVKEYIGMDDYELTINGIISGSNRVRPVTDITNLKNIVDAPIAIDVASAYLQALGIDKIVIASCEWGQQEGSYAYQTFAINAMSDVPQELRLTDV